MLAVALALGVLFLWNNFTHKEEPPPTKAGSASTQPKPATPQVGVAAGSASAVGSSAPAVAGSSVAAGAPPSTGVGTSAASAGPPIEEPPRPPEVPLTLTFDNAVATFSSYCGGLKSWQLTDKRYEHDATRGWLLPEKSLMTMVDPSGKPVAIPAEQLAKLPDCGAFDVNVASSTFVVPPHAVWKGERGLGSRQSLAI
ncbi:MAG TPA: hypothetical protein VK607_04215 [Kofleriaceae bacterium]|nr:hypothetical protein [Kofleriaceae bacterium]